MCEVYEAACPNPVVAPEIIPPKPRKKAATCSVLKEEAKEEVEEEVSDE